MIRVVLVEPSHPGNIGACARAMKNMGLTELMLVRPKLFPHPEAAARASGAADVLERAQVVSTLADAIAGCGFIAATTSRHRDQYFRIIDARAAAARLVAEAAHARVALLFGAERTGLTNEELEAAHLLIRIPACESYPSLNLAMAVQIMAYELFVARGAAPGAAARAVPLAALPSSRYSMSTGRRCSRRLIFVIAPKAARTLWRACAGCCSARSRMRTRSTYCAAF